MVKVVINEQHTLLDVQSKLLNEAFGVGNWTLEKIPAEGLNKEAIVALADRFEDEEGDVVFASPIPLLLGRCCKSLVDVWLFHNDKRIAKEVSDGRGGVKLIHVVAPDGWELLFLS